MEKIASAENLTNSFMKTWFTKVFDGHTDNISGRCVPICFKTSKSW